MIVVSNTSPILGLMLIHQETLLHQLFKNILIPNAVYEELLTYSQDIRQRIQQLSWIQVIAVADQSFVESLLRDLDHGEAAAIALSVEKEADLFLIDEKVGRSIARSHHLQIEGVLAVLIKCKKKGIIQSVKPILERLRNEGGFWIKENLYEDVLEIVNEK